MDNTTSINSRKDIEFKVPIPSLQQFAVNLINSKEEPEIDFYELYNHKKNEIINLLDDEGKSEIKEYLIKDFKEFLFHTSQGVIVARETNKINSNKRINMPDLNNIKIKLADPSLRLHLIKKTILRYLPSFTGSIEEAVAVINEFDEVVLVLENHLSNIQIDENKQNLQQERDFADSLITYSTNGIIAFTNDLTIFAWNKIIEKISGIRKDFVIGKKLFDLFPEFKQTEEGQAVFKVLQGEKVIVNEKKFANGIGYYEASAVPLFGIENEVKGGFIMFNDVTNRRQAAQEIEESRQNLERANAQLMVQVEEFRRSQEELKNNEKLLKRTQQLAHIGTWFWDVKNNEIRWSDELKNLFEINDNLKYLTIKSYLSKVHPEDRSSFLKRMREAVRSKEQFDYEHRIICQKDTIKYIYCQGVPEVLSGKLIVTGFSQDVTQKRKAIETLQASENRFRTLCEKSPDSIFLISKERIIYCNQASLQLFNASAKSQMLMLDLAELHFEEIADGLVSNNFLKEKISEAFLGECLRFECVLKTIQGEPFWSEVILTPIQLEQKDILHAVIRDISKRKKAETAIKLAQDELKLINSQLELRIEERTKDLEEINRNLMRVNADMDNFIYSASHDLKAPILNIEGLINELVQLDSYKQPEVKMMIDMISICVNRFTKTIEDLTDITKSLRSDFDDAQKIDIAELVNDISISIQNMITTTGAKIELELAAFDSIHFSRRNLRSVLYNLINNAIKYRSPERSPKISISTSILGETLVLNVKDNGLGLKEKDKLKVFSMFKRVHTHVEGSGVGLYLVKRIMENGGGSVELESEEGVGSTFKLIFKQ